MGKVKEKVYIQSGYLKILIRYFSVPKGYQDVCMVYDGMDSVFNDLVCFSNFGLPSVKTLFRGTFPTSWMVDLDIGEMF